VATRRIARAVVRWPLMCWDSTLRFALEAQDPSTLLGANQARLSDQGADLAAPTRRGRAGFAGAAD